MESNSSDVTPKAGNNSGCRKRPPSKHGSFKTFLTQVLSDTTLEAQSKPKQLGQRRKEASEELAGDIVNLLGLSDLKKII